MTKSSMLEINYRGFYDIPRVFWVHYDGELYLFDCAFDDAKDGYSDNYKVYLMPDLKNIEIEGSWENIHKKAIRKMGTIPTSSVKFDSTLRREIESSVFELINP